MKKYLLFPVLLLLFALPGPQDEEIPCHCSESEEVIINFLVLKSEKILSVCEGKQGSYLQYRYGMPDKVELSYPERKDETSYDAFEFGYYSRGGGAMNAGMGDYSLSFSRGDATYNVYQRWGYEDETEESYHHELGVEVKVSGKTYDLKGADAGQSGSLSLLEQHDRLSNAFMED